MPSLPTPEQLLALLKAHPRTLEARTRDLAPEDLRTPPEPDAWSAVDVLAHLQSCSDVWGDYMGRILSQDRPRIRAVSPRTYIRMTDYADREFAPLLRQFVARRRELLATLEPLGPDDWARTAIVTGVGKPYSRTLRDYAERLATHEREHVRQIERIVAAVGGA